MGGMPLQPRIVPIAEADLDTVAPLVNRAFGIYAHLFTGTRTSPADYRDEAGEDARVILIEDGGRLVATAMVAPADRFLAPELHGPTGTNREPVTAAPVDGAHPLRLAGDLQVAVVPYTDYLFLVGSQRQAH